MAQFTDEYILYLIKQYYEKPKAKAHAELLINKWSDIAEFMRLFMYNLDIDNATGETLDIIGRIVNLSRNINAVIPISYFGFSNNTNAKGFADRFNLFRESAPLFDRFGPTYSTLQLNDTEYRKFLKIKIAKNNCIPFLASDADKTSFQQVVFDAFDGGAYVVDNKDQTISLIVSPSVSEDAIRLVINADILPRPVTFSYKEVVQAEPDNSFGFSNNPNSKGFSDRFDSSRVSGTFARKLI